jgi:alpha-galactosidase
VSILIDRSARRFLLTAGEMSYAFELAENDLPINLYWGVKLECADGLPSIADLQFYQHRTNRLSENTRQEYPAFYGEFYNECALKAEYSDGVRSTRLRCQGHTRKEGNGCEILTLSFTDALHPLRLRLFYRVWNDLELIDRWSEIENGSDTSVRLENFASACWQLPATTTDWRLTHLADAGRRRRRLNRIPVTQGRFAMESRTGLSGPFAVPSSRWMTAPPRSWRGGVLRRAPVERQWRICVERGAWDATAVTGGINPFDSRIELKPGETFVTPVFSGGWSREGHSGMSRVLHRYQLRHLLPPAIAAKPLPLIFNSWGCINVHVNEANIRRAETLAAKIGAELFVIDDGWQKALGDWIPDPRNFRTDSAR